MSKCNPFMSFPAVGGGGGNSSPSPIGLPKSGLALKTDFGFIAGAFRWSFDRLVFIDDSGEIVERKNASGLFAPTGLVDSTKYYVYLCTHDSLTGAFPVVSTESTRLGDDFTGLPSGYTHYREIGEFYVDSSGDIVQFARNGDRVIFEDYSDASNTIVSASQLSTSWVNKALPAAMPARAEELKILTTSSYSANQGQRIIFADDDSSLNFEQADEHYMISSWGAYKGNYLNKIHRVMPTDPSMPDGIWYSSTGASTLFAFGMVLAGYKWSV